PSGLFALLAVNSMNRTMNTAASAARLADPAHVGGVLSRRSRAVSRACFLRSSAVGGRPVRPRDSIVPAAVPRCLLRRLRLVWAIVGASLVACRPLLERPRSWRGHLP